MCLASVVLSVVLGAGTAGCGSGRQAAGDQGPADVPADPSTTDRPAVDGGEADCVVPGDVAQEGASDGAATDATDGSVGDQGPRVTPATGEIGAVLTLDPMPVPRANHCSAVVKGRLFVIGGNYKPAGSADFVTLDAVHAAPIQPDGTLGSWEQVGTAPSPVTQCAATSDGSRLLLISGIYQDQAAGGQVYAALVGDGGTLSPFASLAAFPADHDPISGRATVLRPGASDATLAVVAPLVGAQPGMDSTAVEHAPLGDGLGSLVIDTWLSEFRGYPGMAFTAGHLYLIAGYRAGDLTPLADGFGASLDPSARPSSPFALPALPQGVTHGQLVAVDDYLFFIGGKTDVMAGSGLSTVLSAHVLPDGRLEAWVSQTPLPEGRTNHDAVLGGSYIYVTGGASTGSGLDTVYALQVRDVGR